MNKDNNKTPSSKLKGFLNLFISLKMLGIVGVIIFQTSLHNVNHRGGDSIDLKASNQCFYFFITYSINNT